MNIGIFIFRSLFFFLPAYITNITTTISRKIRFLKFIEKPVDFGKTVKGGPILGSHKTWRGVICGVIIGIFVCYFQEWLYQSSLFIKNNSLIPYDKINIFLFGFLISFGAILGDLFFAFLKRRQNIPPGAPWIPFDQINYVIGGFLFSNIYLRIDIIYWIIILISTVLLHILVNYIGYLLGLSRAKL